MFAGAAVNRLLDARVVLIGFAMLMIAAGIRMLREQIPGGGDCALPGGRVNWRGCLPKGRWQGSCPTRLSGSFH